MPLSDDHDVDSLLEQWERIKHASLPKTENINEAINYEFSKKTVEDAAHDIRKSRLENDPHNEQYYSVIFKEQYTRFARHYVYKVLKDG